MCEEFLLFIGEEDDVVHAGTCSEVSCQATYVPAIRSCIFGWVDNAILEYQLHLLSYFCNSGFLS